MREPAWERGRARGKTWLLSWASAGKERKRFGPGVRKRVGPRGWIGPERERSELGAWALGWAERTGPRGKWAGGEGWASGLGWLGKKKVWAGSWVFGLLSVWVLGFSFLFSFLFLVLIQTKLFEFKQNLNSTPMHSNKNKAMHQHECNTKI